MKTKTINPAVVQHIKMYANEVRELYWQQEWLVRCLQRKKMKGVTLDREHLAECSTMKDIVRSAAKIASRDEWCNPTSADLKQVRHEIADYILDEWI